MPVKLSSAEEHLWQVVQDHPEKVIQSSIVQLSEYANVSTATIVRTLKKQGYTGYTAYRQRLLQSVARKEPKYAVLKAADSEIKSVIMKNEIEVNNTLKNLEFGVIEDSIRQIQNARMVYIFARGLSEHLGDELRVKLQLVGKYVEMQNDPNIIKTVAKRVTRDCVVIFITLNGETPELVAAAKALEKQDVTKITFTTNADSAISRYSDLLFVGYKSETTYFPNYEVHSRLPLQVMVRILMDAYAVRTKTK